MQEYDPKIYMNHSESLTRIINLNNQISDRIILLGYDYINKVTGDIRNKKFDKISHSIRLRMKSIIFHYEILHSIYSPDKKLYSRSWDPMIGEHFALRQKFLFDSIIFNSISLFDYFSCLITYIKETNKDNWKKMWTSLVKFTRSNNEFNKSTLGQKILEVEKYWLNPLNEYRAELIHYDTDNLPVSFSWNVMQGNINVLIKAPPKLKKVFKNLSQLEKHEDLNINSVCLWIIETCFKLIIELQEVLIEYIEQHRIFPDEKAIITFNRNKTMS